MRFEGRIEKDGKFWMRLGKRSKNAYARYEQGKAMPSVEKLDELLGAIAPDHRIVWRLAA